MELGMQCIYRNRREIERDRERCEVRGEIQGGKETDAFGGNQRVRERDWPATEAER